MKTAISLFLFLSIAALQAQIKGQVTDAQGEPLIGVNVYIKGTYEGATTDIDGSFVFNPSMEGEQILIASFTGYKPFEKSINASEPTTLSLSLKEEVSVLTGVTITAGSFEASDEKKSTVLKPLDIAMTAGATADIAGALNALPGTTTNGESGRLFVRGGTANETEAFIDGALVHSFYAASPANVPSRSRFSPFLFKGTFFSTGGYSAEYGQALSSVLSLTSNDIPDETRTDISLMTVGTDVSHTQKWEKGSAYGQVQYTNLDPYNDLIDQEYDWDKGFRSVNGTMMLRQKLDKNDMLKVYAHTDRSAMALNMPNINRPEGDDIDLVNNNQYINSTYRRAFGSRSTGYLGISYGNTVEDILINDMDVSDRQTARHIKTYFTSDISQISFKAGGELISLDHTEDVTFAADSTQISSYTNNLYAGFGEVDYYLANDLTLRAGFRYANYSLFNESVLSPRLSMALKTGEHSQLSWAFGKFHQLPANDLMIRAQNLSYEEADHYMVSFQRIHDGKTFRAEVYHKQYDNLVKFDDTNRFNPMGYNNGGYGYARGLDLFWRDSKTIKNGDVWVSYSLIDTERNHRDFPERATPSFAARHNISVVYKHFITSLKTQIGAAFSYNSGRPYHDPNQSGFNQQQTKDFSDLSFNFAYLPRPNLIIYASATNLLGRDNVFGYQFEDTPGNDGFFDSRPITQPAKRFLFVGVFITLTKDRNKNNLENL